MGKNIDQWLDTILLLLICGAIFILNQIGYPSLLRVHSLQGGQTK